MVELSTLQNMGYIGLFCATLLAGTILPAIGIPVIIFLVYKDSSTFLIIAYASAGNWLGGIISYYLGYYCKWEWIERFFLIKQKHLEKVQIYIQKYKTFSALLTGAPVIGDRLTIALGLLKMPKTSTFIYMLVGKIFRYIILVGAISLGFYAKK